VAIMLQCPADVVGGKILFGQRDDLLANPIYLDSCPSPFGRRQKELLLRIASELMTEHAKAAAGIAEARCSFDQCDQVSPSRTLRGTWQTPSFSTVLDKDNG